VRLQEIQTKTQQSDAAHDGNCALKSLDKIRIHPSTLPFEKFNRLVRQNAAAL
jgi:hypothetical protein